jgi:hypothetical protein
MTAFLNQIHLKNVALIRKIPPQRKRSLRAKKALQSAPYKAAKIAGFQISLFLTNVFGVDFSRPPAGKIY